jgi:hypothetical protein
MLSGLVSWVSSRRLIMASLPARPSSFFRSRLVEVMNTIPGVTTTSSCRGGRGPRYIPGYVPFKGPRAGRFTTGMAKIMAELCGDRQPPGISKDIPLFSAEEGRRPCIRWQPLAYPLVLRAAKQISKQKFKAPPRLVELEVALDTEQLQRYCSALISSLYNRLSETDQDLFVAWSKHVTVFQQVKQIGTCRASPDDSPTPMFLRVVFWMPQAFGFYSFFDGELISELEHCSASPFSSSMYWSV